MSPTDLYHPAYETAAAETPAAPAMPANTLQITLKPQFFRYVRDRALAHGITPEVQATLLIQAMWAHHDEWRKQQVAGLSRPGGVPAVAG